jgi:hypothetical protein
MKAGLPVVQSPRASVGGCVGHICATGHGRFAGGCVGFVRSERAEHMHVSGCVGHVLHPGASRFVGGCAGFISFEGHSAAPGQRRVRQARRQTPVAVSEQRPERIAA